MTQAINYGTPSSTVTVGIGLDAFSDKNLKYLATAALAMATGGIGLHLLGAGLAAAPVTGIGTAVGSSLVTASATKLLSRS